MWRHIAAGVAILFGIASVISGGRILFGSEATRAAAGDYVPFVVWFNFLAGFFYVAAGVQLARDKRCAAKAAIGLAAATVLVYAAFGVHALLGGAFTTRTVAAMALRTLLWTVIAVLACRHFGCWRPAGRPPGPRSLPPRAAATPRR